MKNKTMYFIVALLLSGASSMYAAIPQVWDFGAEQVPGMDNRLSEAEINAWFPRYESGAMSAALLSFTASDSVNLRYYAAGAHNHRLRTINPRLTHTDEKSVKDSAGHVFTGMIYSNSSANPRVYIEQEFAMGDTIEYVLSSNGREETYRFYLSDSSYYTTCFFPGHQKDGVKARHYRFVCPKDGKYRLSGLDEKLVVARIIRYPLDRNLTKEEQKALRKQGKHPLKRERVKMANRADFPDTCRLKQVAYRDTLWVGNGGLGRINDALNQVRHMNRQPGQRVIVMIAPGTYDEMLRIDMDDITLKNAATRPSISLRGGGVNVDKNAVRVTAYYGYGYNYFSMNSKQVYDPRTLRANRKGNKPSTINKGGSDSNYWNATVVVSGHNFVAEDIIFENSFNQYISLKETGDSLLAQGKQASRPKQSFSTEVQHKRYRERAAAIAFADSTSGVLNNCRVVSRQDAFYGGDGAFVRVNGGILMGSVDYIFGGMTLVCVETELVMLVSSDSDDRTYITASRAPMGQRGMLFYRCHVRGAIPGVEMEDETPARPGYFGRPWSKSGETVFFETRVDLRQGEDPMIVPVGWSDGLTGVGAPRSYEYRTTYGKDGTPAETQWRAPWTTVLTEPYLPDGTPISPDTWR